MQHELDEARKNPAPHSPTKKEDDLDEIAANYVDQMSERVQSSQSIREKRAKPKRDPLT